MPCFSSFPSMCFCLCRSIALFWPATTSLLLKCRPTYIRRYFLLELGTAWYCTMTRCLFAAAAVFVSSREFVTGIVESIIHE